jgi:hypothetical protein
MSVLPTAENWEVQGWGFLQWHNIHTGFWEYQLAGSKVEKGSLCLIRKVGWKYAQDSQDTEYLLAFLKKVG